MSSPFQEVSDASDSETNEESFQFIDIEAIESDGDGGNVSTDDEHDTDDDAEERDESVDNFIVLDDEIEFDDDIASDDDALDTLNSNMNHIQIKNKLNQSLDEQSDNEMSEQQFLDQLTKPKPNKPQQHSRYYDLVSNDTNAINVSDSSASESDCDVDSGYVDSSEEDNTDNNKDIQQSNAALSDLSTLDFEKLVSRTMVQLALQFEQHDTKDIVPQIDPFSTMQDEISLDTHHHLDMKELLSFMSDDDDTVQESKHDGDNINDPQDFETLIPFERSHNILPDPNPSSSNHPSNLRKSKLNTTTLSGDTFEQEEVRLAERSMKNAITRKMNIESKNYAPPLSQLDTRVRRRRRRDNAGKKWFGMGAGKLTPKNKMHFLMLKYRHMLYRDHKPTKVKEDFVPKYFQMGTIIEGPTEFYSSRLKKRNRRSSWANEYLSNPTTKQWLEEKTRRAQRRIRRPGSKFWAPMKKLNVNNRYKLRKKIIKGRKQNAWNKRR
eukprot:4380_1